MALVQARLQASFQDSAGLRASFEQPLLIDDTTAISALPAAWTAFLAAIEPVTDGKIIHGAWAITMPASSTAGRPASDSNIQQTGIYTYANAIAPDLYGVDTPTLTDTVLTTDKTRIDTGNTSVIAWNAYLLGAVLGGNFTNRAYQVLTSRTGTLKGFRKYRKRTAAVGRTKG